MSTVNRRGHALQFLDAGGDESIHLTHIGTIPGIVIDRVGARNGVGIGRIKSVGSVVSWRAPGSGSFGPPTDCHIEADSGEFLIEDGEDRDKWVKVTSYPAFFPDVEQASDVHITDLYGNEIGLDDVTSGEATAGDVSAFGVTMKNGSSVALTNIGLWLDRSAVGLELSEDNIAFSSPTNEANAVAFPDLAGLGTDIVYIRRTIAAGASANPRIRNVLHARFYANF